MREIPLTQGKVALVDDGDFESLAAHKWWVSRSSGSQWYAKRVVQRDGVCRLLWMHREIMQPPTGMVVLHRNGDGLDNRRSNLLVCTLSEVRHVRPKRVGSSRYRGVYWGKHCGHWRAEIARDGRRYPLGLFDDEDEAARAYNEAARKLYGDIAYQNVIGEAGHGEGAR